MKKNIFKSLIVFLIFAMSMSVFPTVVYAAGNLFEVDGNEDSIYTCIYKMKFDGSEKINIIDDNAWYINIINDDFYYASDKNEGHLYMLDNKTGTTCEIFDHNV
ncbi:hypothetical protein Ctaglu_37660 [Clostridium tagluense]|uniref:Prolow-density lipoprotein receptor-related protein 1-like beta-propeller domain-containing protein n=1 Tax=Clostridium tagluense TaxID=360422 RepID=A0A401URG1_9CLOT|nr:hypothetical protein Ctaglu_37660 [Clostridium tagluense]